MMTPMNSWAMTIAAIDQCRSLDNIVKRRPAADVLTFIGHLRNVNCAGLVGLTSAAGEGGWGDRRPRAQQWIVRRRNAVGQHQRVEIDIAPIGASVCTPSIVM